MLKSLLAALLLASCVSKPTYPTNTDDEKLWKQQYQDGQIDWDEYQELLRTEADHGS